MQIQDRGLGGCGCGCRLCLTQQNPLLKLLHDKWNRKPDRLCLSINEKTIDRIDQMPPCSCRRFVSCLFLLFFFCFLEFLFVLLPFKKQKKHPKQTNFWGKFGNDVSRQLPCFTVCAFFVFSIFRLFEKILAGGRCPPDPPNFGWGGFAPPDPPLDGFSRGATPFLL